MAVSMDDIKKLREETGAGIVEAKKTLESNNGDYEKSKQELQEKGLLRIEKRKDRDALQGLIEAYVHTDKKTGVLLELLCETDFVARTDDFVNLAHELALQIAAMEPVDITDLLAQPWVKEPKTTVGDLVNSVAAKVGENMRIGRFIRYKLGE